MPGEQLPNGDGNTLVFTTLQKYTNVQLFAGGLFQPPANYTYVAPTLTFLPGAFPFSPTPGAPGSGDTIFIVGDLTTAPSPGTATSTLLAVRTTIRQRCDMVNSQFITDAEFNGYINASYFELYDLLVEAYGDDYFSAQPADPYVLTTDGTSEVFGLPNGTSAFLTPKGFTALAFYKMLAVDLNISGDWKPLSKFAIGDRDRGGNTGGFYKRFQGLRYRLQGNFIWFRPLPQAAKQVRLLYVPRLTPLVADSDVIDGVSGWEEYVVLDCIIKAKLKEESDCSTEVALRDAMKLRIQGISENRDAGSPATVADVRGGDCDDDGWAR